MRFKILSIRSPALHSCKTPLCTISVCFSSPFFKGTVSRKRNCNFLRKPNNPEYYGIKTTADFNFIIYKQSMTSTSYSLSISQKNAWIRLFFSLLKSILRLQFQKKIFFKKVQKNNSDSHSDLDLSLTGHRSPPPTTVLVTHSLEEEWLVAEVALVWALAGVLDLVPAQRLLWLVAPGAEGAWVVVGILVHATVGQLLSGKQKKIFFNNVATP